MADASPANQVVRRCRALLVGYVETNKFMQELCVKHKVDCSPPRTNARLLDKVGGQTFAASAE